MNNISFNQAISFGNKQTTLKESFIEAFDDYFYLSGKKAFVVPEEIINGSLATELKDTTHSKTYKVLLGALKVSSYILSLGILPLIFLIGKAILRGSSKFHKIHEIKPINDQIEDNGPINPDIMIKIKRCMKNILYREENDSVKFYGTPVG